MRVGSSNQRGDSDDDDDHDADGDNNHAAPASDDASLNSSIRLLIYLYPFVRHDVSLDSLIQWIQRHRYKMRNIIILCVWIMMMMKQLIMGIIMIINILMGLRFKV